ncbi:MAG TPA: rhodanese-like domain-containing protein [Candidatus Dormibacteraeota bacterium]|nr:rhodanese-like domain-containing protein [Candidatus Dormibacteraeota bacterium]
MGIGIRDMIGELQPRVPTTSVPDVKQGMDTGTIDYLIDVRDAGEYRRGHLPGARNISRGLLELKLDPNAPMADPELAGKWDAKIVLYCMKPPGFRSLSAADTLARMGYTNVTQLAGGVDGWAEAGLPVEADAG